MCQVRQSNIKGVHEEKLRWQSFLAGTSFIHLYQNYVLLAGGFHGTTDMTRLRDSGGTKACKKPVWGNGKPQKVFLILPFILAMMHA